ncbi:hypothetical protein C8Q78DRAFT_313838 [Trametes maxima]|nr:hypothetical protein C8Q78DRAFT_313838 [Trametes maxima]
MNRTKLPPRMRSFQQVELDQPNRRSKGICRTKTQPSVFLNGLVPPPAQPTQTEPSDCASASGSDVPPPVPHTASLPQAILHPIYSNLSQSRAGGLPRATATPRTRFQASLNPGPPHMRSKKRLRRASLGYSYQSTLRY